MMLSNATEQLCTKADDQFLLYILLIVGGWLSSISCCLGLIVNFFSITIFRMQQMRNLSTNIYLLALTIVNSFWLVLFLIFYSLRLIIIVPIMIKTNTRQIYNPYNELFFRLDIYFYRFLDV